MNDLVKTTRKNFLKWSGLSFVGGWLLAGKRFSDPEKPESGDRACHSHPLAAASRIRPARNSVVRKSV